MRNLALIASIVLIVAACGTEASTPTVDAAAQQTSVVTSAPAATTSQPPATEMTMDSTMHDDADHEEPADHEEEPANHDDEADHEESLETPDRDMTIIMNEFAFEPDSITVAAGETVRFVVSNEGAIEHEFRLTTKHSAQEHIEAGHEGHDDEAASTDHGHKEVLLLVAAGETADIIVTFDDADEFDVVACLLPGHYEAGMLAEFAIE